MLGDHLLKYICCYKTNDLKILLLKITTIFVLMILQLKIQTRLSSWFIQFHVISSGTRMLKMFFPLISSFSSEMASRAGWVHQTGAMCLRSQHLFVGCVSVSLCVTSGSLSRSVPLALALSLTLIPCDPLTWCHTKFPHMVSPAGQPDFLHGSSEIPKVQK